MTERMENVERAVDAVIEKTGGEIRLAMPLGLGKPNRFVNALYRRVEQDPSLTLDIFTALSLGRPGAGSDLEARFLEPFADRVFGDYEELAYLQPARKSELPANIRVFEFFFQPGSMLGSDSAQQHYISSNYTHVARDLNARNINVVAQLLAHRNEGNVEGNDEYSFSCNPEVTLDLMPLLLARREAGETIVSVGQVHRDLPFMENDARLDDWLAHMDILVDDPDGHTRLFSTPNMPVNVQDHFVGLHASTLIRDGGTLQIGIGALGDALVHHLRLRDQDNARYLRPLNDWGIPESQQRMIDHEGGTAAFQEGLYGCSEMVTHGLLQLVKDRIIRRPVYDWAPLQQLEMHEPNQPGLALLDLLREQSAINRRLGRAQIRTLKRFGIFRGEVHKQGDQLTLPNGVQVANDLDDRTTREALKAVLGDSLRGGIVMHGGFFLGPQAFYERLRGLSDEERNAINMTRISYVNHLHGDEELKRLQRQDARFVNTAFTVTLLGAGVADQIDDGRVLSGVGGQYNFVSQAHELEGGRSILMVRSWRERASEAMSNVVFAYGHNTIPRHLRDVVVTEYGVADLRGKTDEEVVMAMLNVSDSRFQIGLMEEAQAAGKLRKDYQIPEAHRRNNPEHLHDIAERCGDTSFPLFPLGSDFTETEQRLLKALTWLKEKVSHKEYMELGNKALFHEGSESEFAAELERMELRDPDGVKAHIYQRLLLTALEAAT
ncbi:MAG: acetyl-CoA hydrolase/transferase C-terminal domain-containing protein [Pseudomonadota bacterium]|uniref:acetyl-CoA hydrolase/transferase C-terminal domain-containing protein n=1 Tax=Alcanivorax sp. TaxID=1872427 RepID=UPI0025B8ED82|nr:acetyl-CoA hydrolase/transferase C-terminal domain-containing protein [Alcanivorax sp.]MED5238907.1 acetyl-CoA hydrolase/transferase C-terminal domain-containing protein [Pseudomonadota bacterium]MEE3320040.1 acetyl-CoA hydrolase/transferase C-terminal domain-containing protein [Pseudomonadota bacterium]